MVWAVGDIHGQVQKLVHLLDLLSLADEDQLVFLGDYVDRGPASQEVLEALLRLKRKRPNSVFLRGNHDQGMLDARDVFDRSRDTSLTFMDIQWWIEYGGRETADSYGGPMEWWKRVPQVHWEFLEETQLEYRAGEFLFVHAGIVPPGVRWTRDEDPRMWIREPFLQFEGDLGAVVVFGHTPQTSGRPYFGSNKIGVDTGAGFAGPLTAIGLEVAVPYHEQTPQVVQVQ